jgi:hypothetical protein
MLARLGDVLYGLCSRCFVRCDRQPDPRKQLQAGKLHWRHGDLAHCARLPLCVGGALTEDENDRHLG